MNTVIKILILNLIILLLACKREPRYFYIPENIRQALLYYKNNGDTLKLLKNNNDTLIFLIGKTIYYNKRTNNRYYEDLSLSAGALNTSYSIIIEANYSGQFSVIFYKINYLNQSQYALRVQNSIKYFESLNIDGKLFNNVYLLSSPDSIFTSNDKGIIKAWNDSVTFSIIE